MNEYNSKLVGVQGGVIVVTETASQDRKRQHTVEQTLLDLVEAVKMSECLSAGFRHSHSLCESGSLALLSDQVVLGRGSCESGSWCAVSSWRRSCWPSGASCCGRLEERRCGRDQQGDDMADQMTDSFHAQKDDAATHDILSHKARISCSCL